MAVPECIHCSIYSNSKQNAPLFAVREQKWGRIQKRKNCLDIPRESNLSELIERKPIGSSKKKTSCVPTGQLQKIVNRPVDSKGALADKKGSNNGSSTKEAIYLWVGWQVKGAPYWAM